MLIPGSPKRDRTDDAFGLILLKRRFDAVMQRSFTSFAGRSVGHDG